MTRQIIQRYEEDAEENEVCSPMAEKEPLHIAFRPKTLSDFFGNNDQIKMLEKEVCTSKRKSFLIRGEKGCGKTSMARVLADIFGAKDGDIFDYNISNMRGVDHARAIDSECRYAPTHGDVKVYILNECHKATNEFQNEMLDVLEFTPPHVRFILVTTEPERLLPTVVDRCVDVHMRRLFYLDMLDFCKYVCKKESLNIDEEVLRGLSRAIEIPRSALIALESLNGVNEKSIIDEIIDRYSRGVTNKETKHLCQALLKGASWRTISDIIKSLKDPPDDIRRNVLNYMNKVLLGGENKRAFLIMYYFMPSVYYVGMAGITYACYALVKGEK